MNEYNNESAEEFNPDQFVQAAVEGAMSTKVENIPKGDYIGFVDSIGAARKITPADPSKKPFASVSIVMRLDAPEVSAQLGRDTLKVRYDLLLDLDPISGGLDTRKGKNTRLGRLRELAGQNGPEAWSFGSLVGTGPYTCKLDWKEDNRDKDLPPEERRVYDTIVSVGSA